MLQFDTEENTISVDTYSPFLDDFGATESDHGSSPKDTPEPIGRYNGAEDNLTVPVNLTTRQTSFATDGLAVAAPTESVIGTQTVESGFPATVTWSGLTEGHRYAWIAVSREAAEPTGVISQFGGTFVATAAGTDTQPPVLTIPEATTVAVGTAFDVLEGVSAVDNTDGDLSDRIEVIGGVDTTSPGVYALTYVVEDTNGNQAIGSRVVTVVEEPTEPDPVDPPTTTASYTGANWVTVTLTAEDSGSGIGDIEYRFGDEGNWVTYSGPFDLKRSDRQLLQYRATSPDGTAEETRCIAFSPGGGRVDVTVAPEDAVCSG